MDKDIETYVKKCTICQTTRKDPPAAPPHPWSPPEKPWTRVHIDYAGPLEGKMFLLITDAHSRWLEIHPTNTSTSSATIELLRKSFASLGLPEVLVSDNGIAFKSSEFSEFLKKNGIRHLLTPPYHPASNGLVERSVQTFKEGLKRLKDGSLNTRLSRFLFKYRLTPHSSTGFSPAELMFGRKLRSTLDLLKPTPDEGAAGAQDRQEATQEGQATPRNFTIGDCVYARNYGAGPKWLPGHIVKVEGSVLYHVKLRDGRVQRRHIDQLRSRLVDCLDATTSPNVEPDNGPQLTDGGPTDQETVADIVPDPPPDSIETSEPETTAEPRPSELQPQSNEWFPATRRHTRIAASTNLEGNL